MVCVSGGGGGSLGCSLLNRFGFSIDSVPPNISCLAGYPQNYNVFKEYKNKTLFEFLNAPPPPPKNYIRKKINK